MSKWVNPGVQMSTASTSFDSKSSSTESNNLGLEMTLDALWRETGLLSQSATTLASEESRKLGKWNSLAIWPHPIRPRRIMRFVLGPFSSNDNERGRT